MWQWAVEFLSLNKKCLKLEADIFRHFFEYFSRYDLVFGVFVAAISWGIYTGFIGT